MSVDQVGAVFESCWEGDSYQGSLQFGVQAFNQVVDLGCVVPPSLLTVLMKSCEVHRETQVALGHSVYPLLGGGLPVRVSVASL